MWNLYRIRKRERVCTKLNSCQAPGYISSHKIKSIVAAKNTNTNISRLFRIANKWNDIGSTNINNQNGLNGTETRKTKDWNERNAHRDEILLTKILPRMLRINENRPKHFYRSKFKMRKWIQMNMQIPIPTMKKPKGTDCPNEKWGYYKSKLRKNWRFSSRVAWPNRILAFPKSIHGATLP